MNDVIELERYRLAHALEPDDWGSDRQYDATFCSTRCAASYPTKPSSRWKIMRSTLPRIPRIGGSGSDTFVFLGN
jgi:hypothetical protein